MQTRLLDAMIEAERAARANGRQPHSWSMSRETRERLGREARSLDGSLGSAPPTSFLGYPIILADRADWVLHHVLPGKRP